LELSIAEYLLWYLSQSYWGLVEKNFPITEPFELDPFGETRDTLKLWCYLTKSERFNKL